MILLSLLHPARKASAGTCSPASHGCTLTVQNHSRWGVPVLDYSAGPVGWNDIGQNVILLPLYVLEQIFFYCRIVIFNPRGSGGLPPLKEVVSTQDWN